MNAIAKMPQSNTFCCCCLTDTDSILRFFSLKPRYATSVIFRRLGQFTFKHGMVIFNFNQLESNELIVTVFYHTEVA